VGRRAHGATKFASSITTNGYSVSFPYQKAAPGGAAAGDGSGAAVGGGKRRPAAAAAAAASGAGCGTAWRPDKRCIAVDAGATVIYALCETVVDPFTGVPREVTWALTRDEWRAQRGDHSRLAASRRWCADLAAEGGAFAALQAVTRKTASLERFLEYARAAHGAAGAQPGAFAAVLAERLKPRWAHAAFRTWSRGHAVLEGFWARVCAGRLEDGTAGVAPVVLYGSAAFAATGRGRRSAPTTAARAACVTVCGARNVHDVDEHRTTKCCSWCDCVLDHVYAPTPLRVHLAAAARAEGGLPLGWRRPPAPPVRAWAKTRGLLRCPSAECWARSFRHRDFDAARLILRNEEHRAGNAGEPLPFLKKGRRPYEEPAGRFTLWPA
jgi:hypothetical protein